MNLPDMLAAGQVLHLPALVTHARRGQHRLRFRYRTDYLLLAPEHAADQRLFSRNRFNLLSVHDRDHGGARGAGEGVKWARARFEDTGLVSRPGLVIALLTQPRLLGHWFTPVSFWLALEGEQVLGAIAEVNNTFGQRHSYMCVQDGFRPIAPTDSLLATKIFHVSPFQDVSGTYRFGFSLREDRLAFRIAYDDDENGLDAVMQGKLAPLTTMAALKACLQRPGGSLRVLLLIYWNALKLKLKGARYRPVPPLPEQDISR